MKNRNGEQIFCELPNKTICALPTWMFNADCARFTLGRPLIRIEALRELREVLTAWQTTSSCDKASLRQSPLEVVHETPSEADRLSTVASAVAYRIQGRDSGDIHDKQKELAVALVGLLISAAQETRRAEAKMNPKLNAKRLSRRAIVYVRQSSPGQVVHNQESQRRQYGLADRAHELGFSDVTVIDDDLGRSGSGFIKRPGFQRLVAEVCSGEVGAIFCIEASRLARNGRDWHHLIELCGMTDAVVVDPDGVYDPSIINDRLLLGLKGTMSEFELNLLRQRSLEAIRQKAQRGELQFCLPIGFCWLQPARLKWIQIAECNKRSSWCLPR